MAGELKNCPFCGGASVGLYRPALGRIWHVHCDDCEIMGQGGVSQEDATLHWNERAATPSGEQPSGVERERRAARAADMLRELSVEPTLGIAVHWLEQEYTLAALSHPVGSVEAEEARRTAADLLGQYADFIRRDVKADDLERHPYLPLIDETIAALQQGGASR